MQDRSQEITLRGGLIGRAKVSLVDCSKRILLLLLLLPLLGLGWSIDGTLGEVILPILVLVSAALLAGGLLEVFLSYTTDTSLVDVVLHSLLLVLATLLGLVQLGHSVVLLSRIGGIDRGHVHGLVRDLGELFLLLLFLKLALFLFGALKSFLLSSFQCRFLDLLLQLFWALPQVVDVHKQV